jgi:NodT family efflux transporter outer membrane factor (OMF) lipoprotein
MMIWVFRLCALFLVVVVSGCIKVGPNYHQEQATRVPSAPVAWQQPLPHGGDLVALGNWWSQFNDPVLLELIDSAQQQSQSMAAAALRIAQARAVLVTANAAAVPTINAAAVGTRGTFQLGGPIIVATTTQAQLQLGWEIDLFGGLSRANEAARARLEAQVANWHEARISVSADIANMYTNFRGCEQLAALARADLTSRVQTADLTQKLSESGFQSPAAASLASASAAEGQSRVAAQSADCDILIKALVAVTGLVEVDLRAKLATQSSKLPTPAMPALKQVPAQVLSQRPDIAAAERDVAAASAEIGVREAERYPRLSLLGNIGPLGFETSAGSINATSWSIGPSLTLPIFDAGRRAANVDTAITAYEVAANNYRTQARRAVREVEEALVRLSSLDIREKESLKASRGYHASLRAMQEKYKFGLASILDLEETRRLSFNADNVLATVRRERVNAFIALYRAVGGGWTASDSLNTLQTAKSTPVDLLKTKAQP